jgi:hypothetical protein
MDLLLSARTPPDFPERAIAIFPDRLARRSRADPPIQVTLRDSFTHDCPVAARPAVFAALPSLR